MREETARRKFVDLTGKRFGRLEVIRRVPRVKKGGARWYCKCDCGTEKEVTAHALVSGTTQSCGCYSREVSSQRRRSNLAGQRFGRLVAVNPTPGTRPGRSAWDCTCDCGNTKSILTVHLTSGRTQSCGCYQTEAARQHNTLDLTGQRFGRLVAIAQVAQVKPGQNRWQLRCDCGQTVYSNTASLRAGAVKSCGCGRLRDDREAVVYRYWYTTLRAGARIRNLAFDMTFEEYQATAKLPCFYCGAEPPMANPYYRAGKPRKKTTARAAAATWAPKNSIDRLDNDLGYVAGNFVPCCMICQEAKMERLVSAYIEWLRRWAAPEKIAALEQRLYEQQVVLAEYRRTHPEAGQHHRVRRPSRLAG
jgi:hypothetical protein